MSNGFTQTHDTPALFGYDSAKQSRKAFIRMFDEPADAARYADTKAGGRSYYAQGWAGDDTWGTVVQKTVAGDDSTVPASDAFLAAMEQHEFPTARRAWMDDVAGAVPNVPAYVAGSPLTMRRRTRNDSASAPLAIVVDVTSSASVSAKKLIKRGAAILALLRSLSSKRPVELWVICGMNGGGEGYFAGFRVATTPLDLATAAHVTSHPGVFRGILYSIINNDANNRRADGQGGGSGGWPFNSIDTYRTNMAAILGPFFSHATQTLFLPPIFGTDPSIDQPEKWLADMIRQYAGEAVEMDEVA